MKDYYLVLGLKRNSTEDSIKQRFKELAFENHPDVSDNENAAEKFIEIYEAYHILGAPEKRAGYDLLYDKYIGKTNYQIHDEESVRDRIQDISAAAREFARQKSKIKYRDFIRDQDCFFITGLKANGMPYSYNMHKTTGISGGVGPMGSIKSTTVSIPVPRSKKAVLVHRTGRLIKAAFILLIIVGLRFEFVQKLKLPEKALLSIAVLMTGGIVTYTFYRFNKTKSLYFNARKYFLVKKYRKKGYKRGFHPMVSTTPIGLITGLFRLIF